VSGISNDLAQPLERGRRDVKGTGLENHNEFVPATTVIDHIDLAIRDTVSDESVGSTYRPAGRGPARLPPHVRRAEGAPRSAV